MAGLPACLLEIIHVPAQPVAIQPWVWLPWWVWAQGGGGKCIWRRLLLQHLLTGRGGGRPSWGGRRYQQANMCNMEEEGGNLAAS